MEVNVFFHPRFLDHNTGFHPETAERLVEARRVLTASALKLQWVTPEPAPVEVVSWVHEPSYVDQVKDLAASGGGRLDWDTVVSPASYDAALLAAGAGLEAVSRATSGSERSFLLVRPPGHHALRSGGMGFCLFNNIAVAARYAQHDLGIRRVLILDWDVHHGNGTQEVFYEDPSVLFISMHQRFHYPGTGAAQEVGKGPGAGHTVNLPVDRGAGDGAALRLLNDVVSPLAQAYRPELFLVSAGYDCQTGDPLGGLTLSREAFQWMAERLSHLAEALGAYGPVCFLEGGYVPEMMAQSIEVTLRGLHGEGVAFTPLVTPAEEAAVALTTREIAPYWPQSFASA